MCDVTANILTDFFFSLSERTGRSARADRLDPALCFPLERLTSRQDPHAPCACKQILPRDRVSSARAQSTPALSSPPAGQHKRQEGEEKKPSKTKQTNKGESLTKNKQVLERTGGEERRRREERMRMKRDGLQLRTGRNQKCARDVYFNPRLLCSLEFDGFL